MSITRVSIPLAIAAVLLVSSPALATLMSYSGVNGASTGSIHAVTDGFGWNPAGWDTQNPGTPYTVANAPALAYSNLVVSSGGEFVSGGNAFTNLGRKLDHNAGGVYDTAGFISNPFTDGDIDQGVLWFSILMRPTANVSSQEVRFTGDTGIAWIPPSTGDAVLKISGGNWGIGIHDGAFTTSGKSVTGSQADLLVARFDMNGASSSVHLWVNPASLGTADPSLASADAAVSGLSADAIEFRNIGLYLGNGVGNGAADELRLGTTYASVTPVIPEPSSALLLSTAVLSLSLNRRRCAA